MSHITDVLDALKTILPDIDPSPQPTPTNVWSWPFDYASISFDSLPIILVAELTNVDIVYNFHQTITKDRDAWTVDIVAFLARQASSPKDQAEIEQKHHPWRRAMAKILSANITLNSTVQQIGDRGNNEFFTYHVGNITDPFQSTNTFWGIRFLLPVIQAPIQARSA